MNQSENESKSSGFFSLPKINSPEQIKQNSKIIGVGMLVEGVVLFAIIVAGALKLFGYI